MSHSPRPVASVRSNPTAALTRVNIARSLTQRRAANRTFSRSVGQYLAQAQRLGLAA